MGEKIRVDVELIDRLKEALGVINRMPIDDIQFYRKGKPIKMKYVEDFKFTGLANVDYAMMEFWKPPKKIE